MADALFLDLLLPELRALIRGLLCFTDRVKLRSTCSSLRREDRAWTTPYYMRAPLHRWRQRGLWTGPDPTFQTAKEALWAEASRVMGATVAQCLPEAGWPFRQTPDMKVYQDLLNPVSGLSVGFRFRDATEAARLPANECIHSWEDRVNGVWHRYSVCSMFTVVVSARGWMLWENGSGADEPDLGRDVADDTNFAAYARTHPTVMAWIGRASSSF
jgi:hypothetical protein